jgi:RsiG-like
MTRVSDELNHPANRRIDRVLDGTFLEGLSDLPLDELRERRDECLAEREYLSLLRRLVQGRAEILQAELTGRGDDIDRAPLVDRLDEILGSEERQGPGRGEAVRIGVPEDEMLLARRRVERLVADAGISDPEALDDERLTDAVELLNTEERSVSESRAAVIAALDTVQAELKRRYKDDPSLALT